jgi:hypothetical protein
MPSVADISVTQPSQHFPNHDKSSFSVEDINSARKRRFSLVESIRKIESQLNHSNLGNLKLNLMVTL